MWQSVQRGYSVHMYKAFHLTISFLAAVPLCILFVCCDNRDASLLFCPSLAPIDVDNLVLVDKLEDVGRVHEDPHGADGSDQEEYPELGPVHHHCHKFPVFSYLQNMDKGKKETWSRDFLLLFPKRWKDREHRRRTYTEEKAKVVTADWGKELLQILVALAILH